jgi:hypothetical protein
MPALTVTFPHVHLHKISFPKNEGDIVGFHADSHKTIIKISLVMKPER